MEIEVFKSIARRCENRYADFMQKAGTGERYYRNRTDVLFQQEKKDGEGNPMRNADNRIPRNYHGLLVNQKTAYAFTTPPIFDVGNAAANKKITQCLGDEYMDNCMQLCINAANTSVGWIHYWIDPDAGFQWAVISSMEIYPVWDKSLQRKLLGVIRSYMELDEEDGKDYRVYEYWTADHIQAFRRLASETLEGLAHYDMFIDQYSGEMVSDMPHDMGEVPFIPFFNNNINTGDLDNVKHLIDVYDKVYSGFINDLDDIQEIIFVLTNYGEESLNGFLEELKKYKTIKVDDNGGASTLSIEIPVEARSIVLEATRKAIFEQGQGYDPQPEKFGDQSGEALKFMYSLLEMKVGFMEAKFRTGFSQLVRAICRYLGVSCDSIVQTWVRTCVKNERELAEICRDSVGIISQRTILRHHPFVEDVDAELKELEKEEQESMEKEDIYGNAFRADSSGRDDVDGSKQQKEEQQ